ncbi:MAG TPA: ATP-dependent helicase HrpB [Steroidobacteraceae bacterium]|nr:ATP-dependent helicase HrpB [Steroidobacteraceae bacterium]
MARLNWREGGSGLPIDAALPSLRAALAGGRNVVLEAPPGAGKSTVVPLALLDEPWARHGRLVMLEPRRLAARAVAARMAATLGERIGETVGLRMRLDTRVSAATRIEVVTEGVLTRMLQSDAALEGTALVAFDEFHERSVHADLGLALALDAQATLAPQLRLLVMSATLDSATLAERLGFAAPIVVSGRSFPIDTRFAGRGAPQLPAATGSHPRGETPESLVAKTVRRALREQSGDVLVFLPGAREIHRVRSLLTAEERDTALRVLPLYGDLPASEQDAALAPSPSGTRRVVLATNIAETSLTLEGIRTVVDCGLVRRAVFDPVTGMGSLLTQRISRASAEQRQGRAGRTAPGVCYRLWSEEAHRALLAQTPAEILEADLAPLALELAAWGVRHAAELRWIDAPPAAMLASAQDLLARLGALDRDGRITTHGRAMAGLGVHPRLAHMLLEARALGRGPLAAQLAAVLSERDLLRRPVAGDADVRSRLELLAGEHAHGEADAGSLRRARATARVLAREIGASDAPSRPLAPQDLEHVGILLAFAYPDRIARRRPGAEGRYLLANGRGASFAEAQSLARHELIVAVDLEDRGRDARILLAAPLDRASLERHFAERLETAERVEWSEREHAVIARRTTSLDALVLEERPLEELAPDAARAAMLEGVRRMGLAALPWTREARELQARVALVRERSPRPGPWPQLDDATLTERLEEWLAPWLEGMTRREHLARLPLEQALRARLDWRAQRELDELAPTHLAVPSGSRVRIDYLDENAPLVAVRLQEVFGLRATPRLVGGAVAITFQLLSPAHRPVQITRDLESFWRGAYAQVRKDLRGRYPRHYWPEDPLVAQPTRRVRPRS